MYYDTDTIENDESSYDSDWCAFVMLVTWNLQSFFSPVLFILHMFLIIGSLYWFWSLCNAAVYISVIFSVVVNDFYN
jgi:hypothetical protein